MTLPRIRDSLRKLASKDTAVALQRFFKTGVGDYGEGDLFLGIKIPPLRRLAAECRDTSWGTVNALLKSKFHEERMLALMILVHRFNIAPEKDRSQIYKFYLARTGWVNNWDLVDGSAPYIIGPFLWQRSRKQLYVFARSHSLWERRISIMATFYFIRRGDFVDAFHIARLLLGDEHDLIHKAVGWMLREIGKRDLAAEEEFLKNHCDRMPRTMLRYAIERFPERLRRKYLEHR